MITATQLRELRETLQDLIAVAPDNETGRAAVLRAHNLNNVHNLDEVTPSPAKNWYKEWTGLTGELLKAAREIPKESPAYPFIKKAIDIVQEWCREEEKGIARFSGPTGNYTPAAKNLIEPDVAAKAIGYENAEELEKAVNLHDIFQQEKAKVQAKFEAATTKHRDLLHLLSKSKLGSLNVQLGQPEIRVRLTWWQRNMLRFQVKRLINTLSRKKFEVKPEGKYLVIWQAR